MGRTSAKNIADRRKVVAKVTRERETALNDMPQKLRTKFRRIEKQVNDVRVENLQYYYQIGQLYVEVREHPDDYRGKSGKAGLVLLQEALSIHARTLRRAAKFADLYDDEALVELIELKEPSTGFCLHWGHVAYLLTVEDANKRHKFAEEAVKKLLDPPALHKHIKEKMGRDGGHGRGHAMPKTIAAQVRQIVTICQQWLAKDEQIWNGEEESVFGNVLNAAPDELTPEIVADLFEVRRLMEAIADKAQENIGMATRVHEHASVTLSKQQTAEEESQPQTSTRNTRALQLT